MFTIYHKVTDKENIISHMDTFSHHQSDLD